MTLSPRLAAGLACEAAESEPGGAEMDRMTELALCRGARHVTVGHGRSAAAARAMAVFARRWAARGGTVLDVVTWPEEAASWLRQATQFAAADPDLWIMAGTPRGWAQMTRRLLWSTPWQPGRTLAFAALGTQRAIDLVGSHNLQGLAGATADGGTWTVCNGSIRVALRLPGQPGILGFGEPGCGMPLMQLGRHLPDLGNTGQLGKHLSPIRILSLPFRRSSW
jgi:hypothetical protein